MQGARSQFNVSGRPGRSFPSQDAPSSPRHSQFQSSPVLPFPSSAIPGPLALLLSGQPYPSRSLPFFYFPGSFCLPVREIGKEKTKRKKNQTGKRHRPNGIPAASDHFLLTRPESFFFFLFSSRHLSFASRRLSRAPFLSDPFARRRIRDDTARSSISATFQPPGTPRNGILDRVYRLDSLPP